MNIIRKYEEKIIPIKYAHEGDVVISGDTAFIVSEVVFKEKIVHAFSLWNYKMVTFNYDDCVIVKPKACIKLDGDGIFRRCI